MDRNDAVTKVHRCRSHDSGPDDNTHQADGDADRVGCPGQLVNQVNQPLDNTPLLH